VQLSECVGLRWGDGPYRGVHGDANGGRKGEEGWECGCASGGDATPGAGRVEFGAVLV